PPPTPCAMRWNERMAWRIARTSEYDCRHRPFMDRRRFMKRILAPLAVLALALPVAARADLPPDVAKAVAAMGHVNDAGATRKIFDPLQPKDPVSAAGLKADRDIAYGSDPLQKVDVVWDGKNTGNRPV